MKKIKIFLLIFGLILLLIAFIAALRLGVEFYFKRKMAFPFVPKEEKAKFLSEFDVKILEEFNKCLKGESDLSTSTLLGFKAKESEALIEKNENICDQIENESFKKECKEALKECSRYREFFSKELTEKETKELLFQCFQEEPNNPFQKTICEAFVFGPESCEKIKGDQKIRRKKVSLAGVEEKEEKVSEEKAKKICKNVGFLGLAFSKKDSSFCEKIEDYFSQISCKMCVNADLSLNQKMVQKLKRDACYEKYALDVARIKKDPGICENIPQKETKRKELYEECLKQSR